MQTIYQGIQHLSDAIQSLGCRRIMLVAGSHAYPALPFRPFIESLPVEWVRFSDYSPNPTYNQICNGLDRFHQQQCQAIVAIGGGSAIDVAKCIKLFAHSDASQNLLSQPFADTGIPLIAIPTTAGTGSESTRFAVCYKEGEKQSVAHPSIVPQVAILEPSVLHTLPPYTRKAALLDALCQAIESWWSVNSTPESIHLAQQAISLIMDHWRGYLGLEPTDASPDLHAAKIMQGSNLAGQAINITQTTGAHAMSYKLTSCYGIAHGHAVAMVLPKLWRHMTSPDAHCTDPRGTEYLHQTFHNIAQALGHPTPQEAIQAFEAMMSAMEMPQHTAPKPDALPEKLCTTVNPIRLKNNPVAITESTALMLYQQILRQ